MNIKWYHRKWSVLMILGTIGPLGLPVLWRSPEFSLAWKWILTLVTVLVTLLLIMVAEMLPLFIAQTLGRF